MGPNRVCQVSESGSLRLHRHRLNVVYWTDNVAPVADAGRCLKWAMTGPRPRRLLENVTARYRCRGAG